MTSHAYNYLLLDWDGCLADSGKIWLTEYKRVFAEYDIYPSDRDIIQIFGDWKGPEKLGIKDNQTFLDNMIAGANSKMLSVDLNEGVKQTLVVLKQQGKKMAIVTSSKLATILPTITRLQLEPLFDIILGKEDFVYEKPNPEIIYTAMDRLGAKKTKTLIVGDSSRDIIAGQNAGITTVLYYPPANKIFYTEAEMQNLKADYLIRDFRELLKIC